MTTPDRPAGIVAENFGPSVSAIYVIEHLPTGFFYIGSSKNVARRRNDHLAMLRRGSHHNIRLQRIHKKYGTEMLRFEVLAFVEPGDLAAVEQRLLDRLRAHPLCLNLAADARSPSRGRKMSVETIEKVRAVHLGRKRSEESCRRMSAARKGKPGHPRSLETRRRMSAAHLGRRPTEETRTKLREAQRSAAIVAGKSERMKRLNAEPAFAAAHRERTIKRNTERTYTEAEREARAAARRGKRASPETRAKIMAARLAFWADPDKRAAMLAARSIARSHRARTAA